MNANKGKKNKLRKRAFELDTDLHVVCERLSTDSRIVGLSQQLVPGGTAVKVTGKKTRSLYAKINFIEQVAILLVCCRQNIV